MHTAIECRQLAVFPQLQHAGDTADAAVINSSVAALLFRLWWEGCESLLLYNPLLLIGRLWGGDGAYLLSQTRCRTYR